MPIMSLKLLFLDGKIIDNFGKLAYRVFVWDIIAQGFR